MEQDKTLDILETILFVSDAPVPAEQICEVIDGIKKEEVQGLVEELNKRLDGRPLQAVEIAGGFQLRTRAEFGEHIKKFHKLGRSTRLSPASLETLSIISYKQPITRQEVDDIRGVDCSGVLRTLLDKGLIKSMGRKKVPGKPMTFGTTKKFLEYFGLIKLSDLPTLKEFPSEMGDQETMEFETEPDAEGKEKQPADLQIEEDVALTEPAEEDYDDEDDEEEIIENDDEDEDADNEMVSEGNEEKKLDDDDDDDEEEDETTKNSG